MAKRCWGFTWKLKRCEEERSKLPVCKKHVWQFVQVMVVLFTGGAIIVTLELYSVYKTKLQELHDRSIHSMIEPSDSGAKTDKKKAYEQWDE